MIDGREAADVVFQAMREERFYILTHPQYNTTVRARLDDILERRNPTNPWAVLLGQEAPKA